MANGNTLNEVREVDKVGETAWQLENLSSPSDVDRLPNGNTVVAENGYVWIYGPNGDRVWRKGVSWAVSVSFTPKAR